MSEIRSFFSGKTVLVTGCTGFVGKVLVEKLLRSCPDVCKVYILLRSKSNMSATERYQLYLQDVVFTELRLKFPEFGDKLEPLSGDLALERLGLAEEVTRTLRETVNVVIHVGANVKFNVPLLEAIDTNYLGTKRVLELAQSMTDLKSFVHVSTAYSNFEMDSIQEIVYPVDESAESIHATCLAIKIAGLSEKEARAYEKRVLGEKNPNTYIFTKRLTETMVESFKDRLPIAIVRPSMVGAAFKEPFPGFVDTYSAATGVFYMVGAKLIPIMVVDLAKKADIIPVDLCANAILAAATASAVRGPGLCVYNCTANSPVLTGTTLKIVKRICAERPFHGKPKTFYQGTCFLKSPTLAQTGLFFSLYTPAFLMGCLSYPAKRDFSALRLSKKLGKSTITCSCMCTREWDFSRINLTQLHNQLSIEDQEIFPVNTNLLVHWNKYLSDYVQGIRKYLLKA